MALPSLQECVAAFDHAAPALLGAAAGSVMLLGVARLAALAMRRASAAARHAVWLLGFVCILLLPVLSAALPGWHVLPPRAAIGLAPPRPADSEAVAASPIPASALPKVQPSAAPPPQPTDPISNKETIMNTTSELPSAGSTPVVAMTPAAPSQVNVSVAPIGRTASPTPARRLG